MLIQRCVKLSFQPIRSGCVGSKLWCNLAFAYGKKNIVWNIGQITWQFKLLYWVFTTTVWCFVSSVCDVSPLIWPVRWTPRPVRWTPMAVRSAPLILCGLWRLITLSTQVLAFQKSWRSFSPIIVCILAHCMLPFWTSRACPCRFILSSGY